MGRAAGAGGRRKVGRFDEKGEVVCLYCKKWAFWDKGRIRRWAEGVW
jgi:hypothetical protein